MPKVDDAPKSNGPAKPPTGIKMTNRGTAGVHTSPRKLGWTPVMPAIPEKAALTKVVAKFRIAPPLKGLAVPIDSLTPDPDNARLHPERNMESICKSLELYGQVKPLVVRRATRVVIAGNGTLAAALRLGWTEIAATFVDMNEVEAAGYGLADNRTAELAKWDFEVVARLDRLLQEAGHESVGWSTDELEVLRAADWVPPTIDDTEFQAGNGEGGGGDGSLLVGFTQDEDLAIMAAVRKARELTNDPEMSKSAAIVFACKTFAEME